MVSPRAKKIIVFIVLTLVVGVCRFYPVFYSTIGKNDKGRYTVGMVIDYEDGYEGKQPVFKYTVNGVEYRKRIRPGITKNYSSSPYLIILDETPIPHFVTGDYYFIKFSEKDPEKSAIIISKRFVHYCLIKNHPANGWDAFPYNSLPCEK
jgi:hypothetical protein